MVSPELLRRYPFFRTLDDAQLKKIAMLCEQEKFDKDALIYKESGFADQLYLLTDGSVDLFYHVEGEYRTKDSPPPKEFLVDDINPGVAFGVDSLVEPFSYDTTARAAQSCSVICLDAVELRKLFEKDVNLAYKLMVQTTRTLMEHLAGMRAKLAAAWA